MISMVLTRSSSTSTERARIRKAQLKAMERQQSREDREALRMTDEQRDILFRSFKEVKTEFSDLDGMCRASRRFSNRRDEDEGPLNAPEVLPTPIPAPEPNAILSDTIVLTTFSPEDTIRASRSGRHATSPIQEIFAPSNHAAEPTTTCSSPQDLERVTTVTLRRVCDDTATATRLDETKCWDVSRSGVLGC